MVFEAMTVAVTGLAVTNNMLNVNSRAARLFGHTDEGALRTHMLGVVEDFRVELPRTAEVIISASRRFVGHLTDYALLGAALERHIALDGSCIDSQ